MRSSLPTPQIARSLQWLVHHGYLVRESSSLRLFFKSHYFPPQFITSDYLLPTHTLSLKILRSLFNGQVYSLWQREWETSYSGSTTSFCFPLIIDHASYPFDFNFFFSQASRNIASSVNTRFVFIFPLILLALWRGSATYPPYPVFLSSLRCSLTGFQYHRWHSLTVIHHFQICRDGDMVAVKEKILVTLSWSSLLIAKFLLLNNYMYKHLSNLKHLYFLSHSRTCSYFDASGTPHIVIIPLCLYSLPLFI